MSKRTASAGLGSLATGAVTAVGIAIQTGLAALVGVLIAREFGRTAETDGFLAAYSVFIVLSLAATVIRLVVLPPLARARDGGRLGSETVGWAASLGLLVVPTLVVGTVAADPIAALLTGFGPEQAQDTAAAALPFMILAASAQLYAGLLSSALAALDSYALAALAYITGSVVGLSYILARIDSGIQAVAVGVAINGILALTVQVVALGLHARNARMPRTALRPEVTSMAKRVREVATAVSLPLALQAVYLLCLPFAAREGVGAVTSLGYAYLAGSAVVAVCASSLGLVTAVPLTRMPAFEGAQVARHVVSSAWPAVVAVGAVSGVFALAGGNVVSSVLGTGYADRVAEDLGWLVVALAPWMVATIGYSLVLPLVFVKGSAGSLPILALAVLVLQVPLAWAGQSLGGLIGLALALALTTFVVLAGMLRVLSAVRPTLRGLAWACAFVAGVALVSFGGASLLDNATVAGLAGLVLFLGLVALLRPPGLRASWRYLRAL